MNGTSPINESCMGFCSDCNTVHSLPLGNAELYARKIMDEFSEIQRLDYLTPKKDADPRLSFDHLFPGERGHMFGVLECEDSFGNNVILRAFSSLQDGIRHIEGWVPPVLDSNIWDNQVLPTQKKIKDFTKRMKREDPHSEAYTGLFENRKKISRELMAALQEQLYFSNFRGDTRSLKEVFYGSKKIPGGVGDCCGPKLLNHAALNKLKPLGLAEFYWGEPTPDGSKVQGQLYPCCKHKCQAILGFILCGINELS